MAALKLSGAVKIGTSSRECARRSLKKVFLVKTSTRNNYVGSRFVKRSRLDNVVKNCGLVNDEHSVDSSNLEEKFGSTRDQLLTAGAIALPGTSTEQFPTQDVQTELIMLSLPAIAGQAIEPLAQLMETAYIGRMGALELASAGISVSIFNIISKVFNIPLLSVATSFVAEDISKYADEDSAAAERKALPSVSTALVLSAGIGLIEAAAMYLGTGPFLSIMGLSTDSTMRIPAEHFLKLRALGAPAVVLYLAVQGIFRGFKDTRTPVICLGKSSKLLVEYSREEFYNLGVNLFGLYKIQLPGPTQPTFSFSFNAFVYVALLLTFILRKLLSASLHAFK